MLGLRVTRIVLLACVVAAAFGCSIFRGIMASASCADVSPEAIRATLVSESGTTVRDVDDEWSTMSVRATRNKVVAHVRFIASPPELLVDVGSYGGLPDGVTDDDLRRRADELTSHLSACHPQLGPWEIEDHTASATRVGDNALAAIVLFMIFVFPVIAVTGLALWLVKRLNAATRARERESQGVSA